MDLLSTKWLSQMEMMNESGLNDQWQHMSSLENESFDFKPVPSSNNITTYDYYNNNNNTNNNNNNYVPQVSKKSWKSSGVLDKASCNNSPCSSTIISFGNNNNRVEKKKASPSSSSIVHHQISNLEEIYAPLEYEETKKGVSRTPEQAQDHVLAERKRREKMTQKFVALSTLIPGLKKLDKATVLGDAINYIKELQERVKDLEVEVKGNHNEEVIAGGAKKRPRFISSYDNDVSSSDENIDGSCISSIVGCGSTDNHQISPEIEVRASEGNMMIRVYCKNQTGVIQEVMSVIEKHNLSMISSSAMPFGHNTLHITIIAQMDGEAELTPKDLADNLRTAILNNLV